MAPHGGDAAAHGHFLAPRGGTVFHVFARLDEVADVKSVILVHQLGDSGGHLAGEAVLVCVKVVGKVRKSDDLMYLLAKKRRKRKRKKYTAE